MNSVKEVRIFKTVYIGLSLATQLSCLWYLQHHENWHRIGRFSECYILLLIVLSELLKEKLTRLYFKYNDIKQSGKGVLQHSLLQRIWYAALVQLSTFFVYAFLCFTLGAPIFHSYEKTFVLSLILTLLTVTPAVFMFGGVDILEVYFTYYDVQVTAWQCTVWSLIKSHTIGAISGAWVGSFVSPLDWDRAWQEYPIPNVIGALLGSVLASLYSLARVLCESRERFAPLKILF